MEQKPNPARTQAMLAAALAGQSKALIGRRWGISRARVSFLLRPWRSEIDSAHVRLGLPLRREEGADGATEVA